MIASTSSKPTSLPAKERWLVIIILLLAWFLRWHALMASPPGWRDDDLIELYTFSRRIVEEGPVLYFPGASGHEPLYHTLRAPIIALGGINQASARWVSAAAGLLTVLLTWSVGRRVLGRETGLIASALTAVAFWSLMYSRVAIRHIGMLPWALIAIYWGWRQLQDTEAPGLRAIAGIAVGTAGAMLTYYAGRLMPALLTAAYPIIEVGHLCRRSSTHHRNRAISWLRHGVTRLREQRRLPGYVAGLAIGLLLAAPMFWTASHLPGADARVGELAVPIHALREGDPGPLLQTTWTTLGMFHARGDPEWLYNISERPVFGPVSATLFYLSLGLTLTKARQPEQRFLLLWLATGLAPAFISLPPSSFGHTILAMPTVYLALASLIPDLRRLLATWVQQPGRSFIVAAGLVLVMLIGARDLPDYFTTWTEHSMVQFLYRADYRALSRYLKGHTELDKVAVGSMLFGPWDKVALATDAPSNAGSIRWFNPARALIVIEGKDTPIFLQEEGERHPEIAVMLVQTNQITAPEGMQGYQVSPPTIPPDAIRHDARGRALSIQPLAGAIRLDAVSWQPPEAPESPGWLATRWTVEAPMPLPPETLIPNPPPPGVYHGPRLKVFAHLRCDATTGGTKRAGGCEDGIAGIDDGMWVDPYSLRPGDVILQYHKFDDSEEVAAASSVVLGLYDPLTGERWTTERGEDKLEIALEMSE
jgi:hypothetical protein